MFGHHDPAARSLSTAGLVAIAIWRLVRHRLSLTQPVQLPPAHTFTDYQAFVLGKGTLDVQQQLSLRTVAQRRLVEKDDFYASSL